MHDGLSIQQETFAARMARLGGSLGAAGQRVAGFIARKPATVLAGSALELAQMRAHPMLP